VAALGKVYDWLSGEGVAASRQAACDSTDRFQAGVMKQMNFWCGGVETLDQYATVQGGGPMACADEQQPGHPAFGSLGVPGNARRWPPGTVGSTLRL
jgi:hypothetical protein